FRHENPAQRVGGVENPPMIALQIPAYVDVFRHHVEAPIAYAVQSLFPKSGDNAGHRKDAAIDSLCALDHPNDRRKLADLDVTDEGRARADARVARGRA